MSKTVSGAATGYLYDGVNPVQELTGTTPSANILTGLGVDEFYRRTDPSGSRDMLTDALGSIIALTDTLAQIKTQYSYSPYGATTATGEANTNPFQYTGRENDGTGVYYYRARYYNPAFGRFVSSDPKSVGEHVQTALADLRSRLLDQLPLELNAYAYVANNPLRWTDPTGENAAFLRVCILVAQAYFSKRGPTPPAPKPTDPTPIVQQIPKPKPPNSVP